MKQFNIAPGEIPKTFYVFVNQYSFIAQHNYKMTGVFSSAAYSSLSFDKAFLEKYRNDSIDYFPFDPHKNDLMALSPYYVTAINDIRIETDAEKCRYRYFKYYPSRLSALYAFGSYSDCEIVADRYSWDMETVKEFTIKDDNEYVRIAKVNMEIVSLAREFYKNTMMSEDGCEQIWKYYWSGQGSIQMEGPSFEVLGLRKKYDSEIIWEYLIEGQLIKSTK